MSLLQFTPYPQETVQAVVKKQLKNEKEKERRDREAEIIGELRALVAKCDQEFMQTSRLEKMDVLRGAKELIEKQNREIAALKISLLTFQQSFELLQQQNIQLFWQNLKLKSLRDEGKENCEPVKASTPEPCENSLCDSDIGTPKLNASSSSEEVSPLTSSQNKVWRAW